MEDAAYLPWLQIRDLRREAGLRRLAVSGGEHDEDDGREIERRIDGRSNWEKGDGGRRADVDGRRRGSWVEIWVCETKEAESVGGERASERESERKGRRTIDVTASWLLWCRSFVGCAAGCGPRLRVLGGTSEAGRGAALSWAATGCWRTIDTYSMGRRQMLSPRRHTLARLSALCCLAACWAPRCLAVSAGT